MLNKKNNVQVDKVIVMDNPLNNGYCKQCEWCDNEICARPYVGIECKFISRCTSIKEKKYDK